MNRLTKILIGLIAIWLLIAVNNMAFQDDQVKQETYKKNVCLGLWPDYEGRNPDCKEVKK